MNRFRSPLHLFLCLIVFASLFSGFAASAAPLKPQPRSCEAKIAVTSVESAAPQPKFDCCLTFGKLPVSSKVQIGVAPYDPCAPVVDGTCGITYPAGAVVGEIPFDQQAYYAPGLEAEGVTINAGTYWVTGLGEADNGDGYYQIVVACQFLFVPEATVQPSFQSPWSGQPLPTTPPVS